VGVACSLLLDTTANQCTTTQDCVNRGDAFAGLQCVNSVCGSPADAGPWACLGDVVVPQSTNVTVDVIVPLIDLATQMPVTSASALVCAKIDVNCTSPLAATQPDASGLLHLTLQAGFDGFVLVLPVIPDGGAPDAGDGGVPDVIVPSIVFFNPPIEHDLTYTTIVLVKTSALAQIAAVEKTTLDPTLGAVFMETVDCNGHPAAGVSVTLDSTGATTQGFYFSGGLPVLNGAGTDVSGFAGFVNAPLGTRTVKASLNATQQYIGTASVFTLASMISYTTLAPSP